VHQNPLRLLKELIIAIQSYSQAHQFIIKHKLWKWILIPGLLYTLLFLTGMYYFGQTAGDFIEWMAMKTGLRGWIDQFSNSFVGFLFVFGTALLWLVLMLLYFSLFKFLFLIIGSPVFAYLSEKTASIIEGKDFPFSFTQLGKDILRGIKLALRNSVWQTVYVLSILLLSLIPLIGWLTPILAVLVECYYYGFSMLDYSMERQKKSPAESIFYIGNHKGLAIGNGFIFYLMHMFPIIGWILAPSYAVVAATLSTYPNSSKQ
jgi:CysZ protein